MPTRCLSIHASYRCAHSGACCSDVWAIPVEPRVVEIVQRRGIAPVWGDTPFARVEDAGVASDLVLAHLDGACVFFDARAGRTCAIHRAAGAEALPSSCRHFPRVYLRDARGLSLSLSHFCPTAASLLLADVPLTIVDAAAPLALDEPVEGLDAVDALPPLLRPDLLTSIAAYDAWERTAIATLATAEASHAAALDRIAAATEIVRQWRPGRGALDRLVLAAFDGADPTSVTRGDDRARLALFDRCCPAAAARPGLGVAGTADAALALIEFDLPVRRFLAARLFANWIAYRGRGLRTIVEWLRICLAVLRSQIAARAAASGGRADAAIFTESVREADRLLLHVLDSQKLARALIPIETT